MDSQQKILNDNFVCCVKENNIAKVKKSIEAGADVNAVDSEFGRPALMYAIFNENKDMFQFLLEKGANPNKMADFRGSYFSPLMVCAMMNSYKKASKAQKEMAQILIEKGADINATDHHGRTALVLSIYYCQPEMAELLIKNGADVSKAPDERATALRIAQTNWSQRQDFKNVFVLLEQKNGKVQSPFAKPIVKQEVKLSIDKMTCQNEKN